MQDETETFRRELVHAINADPEQLERANLEAKHDQVWDYAQLDRDFDVIGFCAPFVTVQRLSDGKKGSLTFSASPRFYWGFTKD